MDVVDGLVEPNNILVFFSLKTDKHILYRIGEMTIYNFNRFLKQNILSDTNAT